MTGDSGSGVVARFGTAWPDPTGSLPDAVVLHLRAVTHQAALSASSRAVPPSLVDFLR